MQTSEAKTPSRAEVGRRRAASPTPFDLAQVRAAFPALQQRVHDRPLIYLDNAATTQKPQAVIDAVVHAYTHLSGNVHRGVHALSQNATLAFEGARRTVARFLRAPSVREIVFVRGATEGINLVAHSFGAAAVRAGDEVLVSELEHHANWVPWQLMCRRQGAHFKVVPIDARGDIDLVAYRQMLGPRTKVVALGHVSNALGTVNPVAHMVQLARQHSPAVVLVDGAQAALHMPVDVTELGCDFYVFSGHKVYGPTGIGALWGRRELLDLMPPYQSGGDMIDSVGADETTFNVVPNKFEAGTPHIAGAIGLAAALKYVERVGLVAIAKHERDLLAHAIGSLDQVPGLRRLGRPQQQAAVVAFVLEGVHPHDIGTVLDQSGIAIRSGHHCAQPLAHRLGHGATVRCSMAMYNSRDELTQLAEGLAGVRRMFAPQKP